MTANQELTVSLIDTAQKNIPPENWQKLPPSSRIKILFDYLCPAGGFTEERYHNDGPRYWEKKKLL